VFLLRDIEAIGPQLALGDINQLVMVDREVTRTHRRRLFDFLELIVADFIGGVD
jgi:hypothetical protein